MLRLLLSAYLKDGVAYRVGRRALASEAFSQRGSAGSKEQLTSHAGGVEKVDKKCYICRVLLNENGKLELTPKGQELDKKTNGKLMKCLNWVSESVGSSGLKLGDSLLIPDLDKYTAHEAVVLSYCGPKNAKVNPAEGLDEMKENVRWCFGAGRKALNLIKFDKLDIDASDDGLKAAEEGISLAKWKLTEEFTACLAEISNPSSEGIAFANAQNWARYISEMQTKMTPNGVVEEAKKHLSKLGVSVKSYVKEEIVKKKMQAFLAVAQGSSVAPVLLECEYTGKKGAPLVLMVAKGVTFDSGGLCLKKREDMLTHSGMTGAAAALGTMMGLATLKVPVNVKLLVPLCENMISGQCLKVGDVVHTLKGDDVLIEDTDLEGHLMLADVLTYGQTQFKPKYVISVASLTPGIVQATSGGCYGCFTKSDDLWKIAHDAGTETGDRPWRLPVWDYYSKEAIDDSPLYKLKNRGSGIASHCIGAAFLDKFVTSDWLHYDITGVGKMAADRIPAYLDPNLMTGRPTRALMQTIIGIGKKKGEGNRCAVM